MKTATIHKLMLSAIRILSFLMDKKIVFNDITRRMAMERLRNRLEYIKDKSLTVYYKTLMDHHHDVMQILPPDAGRYKNMRRAIIQVMDDAEKKINARAYRVMITV